MRFIPILLLVHNSNEDCSSCRTEGIHAEIIRRPTVLSSLVRVDYTNAIFT